MLDSILSMLGQGVSFCLGLFTTFMNETGMGGLFMACFGIFTVVSLLIMPLRGGRTISLPSNESKNKRRSEDVEE